LLCSCSVSVVVHAPKFAWWRRVRHFHRRQPAALVSVKRKVRSAGDQWSLFGETLLHYCVCESFGFWRCLVAIVQTITQPPAQYPIEAAALRIGAFFKLGAILIKESRHLSENLCRRARSFANPPVSYRLFSGLANYFRLPPKAHRNDADKLIECELNGCLGKQPARSRKLRQPK
jgi:hypothetical protein